METKKTSKKKVVKKKATTTKKKSPTKKKEPVFDTDELLLQWGLKKENIKRVVLSSNIDRDKYIFYTKKFPWRKSVTFKRDQTYTLLDGGKSGMTGSPSDGMKKMGMLLEQIGFFIWIEG